MKDHHYKSVEEFTGKILKGREKTAGFERIQFMKKTTGFNI